MEYTENQKVTLSKLETLIQEQGSQAGASSVLGITPSVISSLRNRRLFQSKRTVPKDIQD